MRNKIITLAIMLASTVIILPASSLAAATGEKAASLTPATLAAEPQIKIRIGKGRRHHGNRGHRRFRMVKQVYWDHGHKRVRWVKQYY